MLLPMHGKQLNNMGKLIKFGEDVEGYDIPVLNEREIRAAAGIMFLAISISLAFTLAKGNFLLIKYVSTFFLVDFLIRVFITPKYSPLLITGRFFVRNQVPEYVGAQQKKFAWKIGVVLSATIFIFLVIINGASPITGIGCFLCLMFLFFETAFGICLGCKLYAMFHKGKVQYCPGEVCDPKSKQPIQKISRMQVLIVLGFIAIILFAVFFFNDYFSKKPYDLFGIYGSEKVK